MLTEDLKLEIKSYALESLPNECCGFIILNNGLTKVFRCKNAATEREKHAIIDGNDYLKAVTNGDIIAMYHSHPTGGRSFSEVDKTTSENHNIDLVVYKVEDDSFEEYKPCGYKNPFIGKEFKIGKQDCLSLLRDYYKQKLNISINDYPRDDKWTENTEVWYDEDYDKEGFIKVADGFTSISDLKVHDVILLKFLDIPHASHIAIYLGENAILHHPRARFSCIENYSDAFKKRTMMVIRHKDVY